MISVGEHPRARGENTAQCPPALAEKGTSPRTRGKQLVGGERRNRGGNIPAHAGKTEEQSDEAAGDEEHPRARGENEVGKGWSETITGTSPRTRGKQLTDRLEAVRERNIPAHAGKTPRSGLMWCLAREHPRARGENRYVSCNRRPNGGTSPRTRGKRLRVFSRIPSQRNIPAHAGKTFGYQCSWLPWQEHPRARGENIEHACLGNVCQGTSPRTRGKPSSGRCWPRGRGNIPAHAGKTVAMTSTAAFGTEHPRARGENAGSSHQ